MATGLTRTRGRFDCVSMRREERNGQVCKAAAMRNCRCRVHGGKTPAGPAIIYTSRKDVLGTARNG